MYFDGSLKGKGMGAGVVLISPQGDCFRYAIQLHFQVSNNVAEYEVLVNNLRITSYLGVHRLYVQGNLELMVDQVMKESSCSNVKMVAYCREVWKLEEKFDRLELQHIL